MAMTTTDTTFGLVLTCVSNGKRLAVWESGDKQLKVILRDHYTGKLIASKTFRDCETQHHDSERWLNDKVGWPNDFAGFLTNRIWEHTESHTHGLTTTVDGEVI